MTIASITLALILVLAQFIFAPFLIDRFVKIHWTSGMAVSPEFDAWLNLTCRQLKIPTPRFGIIEDGAPSAFTYGNTPANARVRSFSCLAKSTSRTSTRSRS